ncbi:hypothetical protein J3R30DRAFT_3718162 [Lentinula aciculospora]|uniref:DUF6534 domain-containing protein n=1 Tax=Lentinula aciculospora TaxID=153920 RepID=A0A9W8ZW55_9AGAR|nr:hypothetical protein J3R30DRAFT_3718162 [Lentinula aciculospora]
MNSSSTDSPSTLSGINPDNTFGAAFIGYSFACAVLGILTSQVSNYYQKFVADPKPVKILVGIIWSLELLHVILISHALYHYTISLFSSVLEMITEHVIWSLVTQVLVAAISGDIVKICFVLRVWRFSRRNIFITGIIFTVFLVQFGLIIAFIVAAYNLQSLLELSKLNVLGSMALVTGALGDVLTAITLSFYLRRLRTGYREPDSLVNNLTGYAINTGALTSTMSLLTLILVRHKYHAFAVSLMCTLNTRKQIGGRALEEDESGHISGGAIIPTSNDATTVPTAFKTGSSDHSRPGPGNHIQPYLLRENTESPSRMDVKSPLPVVSARNRRISVVNSTIQVQNSESKANRMGIVGISMLKKA